MNALKYITLVVPTYRRQSYLSRLVHFYNHYPVQLLIVDGTETNSWSGVKQAASNIRYFHLPGESIYKRVDFAMIRVETPFCAWLGDDEFQLPSGLARSADILLKRNDVVSSIGSCVGFNVTISGVRAGSVYGYTSKEFSSFLPQRIEEYFLHYSPSMAYALWRSEHLIKASSLSSSMDWSCGSLGEWIQAFCGLSLGNHVIHGEVQWLRSDENPPQQSQLNRSIQINQWWRESIYETERQALIKRCESFLKKHLSCDKSYALALVEMAFEFKVFSEQQNRGLQVLGLQPQKSYNRNYSQSLSKVLNASSPNPPCDEEIAMLIKSICMPYKKVLNP